MTSFKLATKVNRHFNDQRIAEGAMKAAIGQPCKAPGCGFPLYSVDGGVLAEAVRTLRPSLRSPSLPSAIHKGAEPQPGRSYLLCPRCDAYGLGVELETPFPIQAATGEETDVGKIKDLWENDRGP